jgi:sodium-dependent dicarboxylate transporter 2/3/5
MTPIGTPPNALAYAYGYLTTWDMVKTGAILNLIGVFIVVAWTAALGGPILGIHLNQVPDWAIRTPANVTSF